MNTMTSYPNLTTGPEPEPEPDLVSNGTQEEIIEDLEESFTVVKDELERLESRLATVEDRLSNLNPNPCLRVSNPRMAAFHHVYDPAHRTW